MLNDYCIRMLRDPGIQRNNSPHRKVWHPNVFIQEHAFISQFTRGIVQFVKVCTTQMIVGGFHTRINDIGRFLMIGLGINFWNRSWIYRAWYSIGGVKGHIPIRYYFGDFVWKYKYVLYRSSTLKRRRYLTRPRTVMVETLRCGQNVHNFS